VHVNASAHDASVAATPRRPGARITGLYPKAWRQRYGDELADLLEGGSLGLRDRVDLLRGALDAHLHPERRSPLPVVAALSASALATAHAIVLGVQPVPTDWPGYLMDALPLIAGAVAALIPALVGLWLRLGDDDGRIGRIGLLVALAGHALWLAALVGVMLRIDYGPLTAIAATAAAIGTGALGVALAGRSRLVLGGLLAIAALAGVAPPALGWPLFAAAWTGVAVALTLEFAGSGLTGQGPRRA
jgi:hypothetical protein